ncbi:MAG: alpha/beta hydrolase [Oscillospiraceae bacterium]|jgi:pimeloyl-ACP methyl ester carboxylesterase|nr:alpha/beta hydrolase [Oscillospiraceae bacterium]
MKRKTYNLETQYLEGEPGKPLLVFVHGMCGGAWIWDNFVEYFSSEGFPCFALSLRGHGGSGGAGLFRTHLHSFNDYVRDLEIALSGLSGRKPVLIGHSMGGAIIQRYIELHPNDASGAVLLASVPRSERNARRACKGKVIFRLLGSSNPALSAFAVLGVRRIPGLMKSKCCNYLDADSAKKFAESMSRESLCAALQIAFGRIYREPKFGGQPPVLVAGGSLDYLFSSDEFKATAEYYGSEPVIFPDICHEMAIDPNWRAIVDAIRGFLDDIIDNKR